MKHKFTERANICWTLEDYALVLEQVESFLALQSFFYLYSRQTEKRGQAMWFAFQATTNLLDFHQWFTFGIDSFPSKLSPGTKSKERLVLETMSRTIRRKPNHQLAWRKHRIINIFYNCLFGIKEDKSLMRKMIVKARMTSHEFSSRKLFH